MGNSGWHGVVLFVQIAAAFFAFLGMPIAATLPGSNKMVATHEDKPFLNLSQELAQAFFFSLCKKVGSHSRNKWDKLDCWPLGCVGINNLLACFASDGAAFALLPSGADIAGHVPQISSQGAGSHAFITSFWDPPGLALVLMHPTHFWHQFAMLGIPLEFLPSAQSTSTSL